MKKTALCLILSLCLIFGVSSSAYATSIYDSNTNDFAITRTFAHLTCNLSIYNGSLSKIAFFQYSSDVGSTTYIITLEQYTSAGGWQPYERISGVTSANPFMYDVLTNPPKGFTYRLHMYASAPGFPGMETFSLPVAY